MARKATYIYRVNISNADGVKKTEYCYARNARAAISGVKSLNEPSKYTQYKAVAFGEVEFRRHPEIFEMVPLDEIQRVVNNKWGTADKYSNRKDHRGPVIPKGAVFVPAGKEEEVVI